MRGEFPETLCIEQGVVLSCWFAEWKVRWTSRVLWMAVVSQSSVKSVGRKRGLRRSEQTLSSLIIADVATSFAHMDLQCLTAASAVHENIQKG